MDRSYIVAAVFGSVLCFFLRKKEFQRVLLYRCNLFWLFWFQSRGSLGTIGHVVLWTPLILYVIDELISNLLQ